MHTKILLATASCIHLPCVKQSCVPCCRDVDDLVNALNINVVGTWAVTKAFLPLLKKGNQKTILNITSDAACLSLMAAQLQKEEPMVDVGMALSYKASKAALNMRMFPRTSSPCCVNCM